MKPFPPRFPFSWLHGRGYDEDYVVRVSRDELERRFGPPHLVKPVDGLGPEEVWLWRCDCGLGLALVHMPLGHRDCCEVFAEYPELEHVLAHLGWGPELVRWRQPSAPPPPKDGWAVVRQDDAGNRYEVCILRLQAHAECLANMMEARAHKQSYFVEVRGTPPKAERLREGWAVIRQDEHGNRAEVAVHPREHYARRLAAAYEAEPRHKQTYSVERVGPAPKKS